MNFIGKIIKFFMDNPQEEQYTGPISDPTCPTCNINLQDKKWLDASFYICNDCNGIWINSDNFPKLLKKKEEELEGIFAYTEENLNIRYNYMTPRDLRKCPVCPNMMMNIQFDSSSGIWLDHCPANHGIWLDAGEINLVLQYRKLLEEHGGILPGQIIGITDQFRKEMNEQVGGFKLKTYHLDDGKI
ncbi:MAG TPA: zf-TFIIB domain-containing protein [Candidatus Eremiobacteraeota bacterium]|nr:MAG: hypothetical protein BWY64_03932 [bacterium ADurb.Bin363]HPZ09682.1 zf-TFIIB domain-containing protein [Candidatus Eremiobacteraeota bacterium]